jgi:predicted alpha/beta hydrolase family esterase
MRMPVVFIHGGGPGAYAADRPLAASLQAALGPAYAVRYPQMPREEDPEYESWKARIAQELATLDRAVVLVGHSLGGSVLLKYLSEEPVEPALVGLFLLATPYWGADADWQRNEYALDVDFAAKLPPIPRIYLYHSQDDDIVPLAHLARYAAKLPQATIRPFTRGGHQFRNDLADVAADIKGAR